jgi:hypothetical protein
LAPASVQASAVAIAMTVSFNRVAMRTFKNRRVDGVA